MGLFCKKNVTVSDQQMADLKRRAEKANPESMFSPRMIKRRKMSSEQLRKSRWS